MAERKESDTSKLTKEDNLVLDQAIKSMCDIDSIMQTVLNERDRFSIHTDTTSRRASHLNPYSL